ncbi:MAG: discoidin domain-containing protein [Spirochaetota bacterium]|nr:discoidin domain-containing protein [Spirochaetota bacterium]
MKFVKNLFAYFGLLFIIIMLFHLQKAFAQLLSGGIDTFFQTTETDKEGGSKDRTWNFSRGYFLGFRNTISPQMNYLFDVRVTRNETDIQETTSFFNTGQFNVTNYLFNGNLGYQFIDRNPSDTPRFTSNSWNLNLYSNLKELPKLRFQYNQKRDHDHLDEHEIDNSSKQLSSGIQYKYKIFNMLFDYSQMTTEDYVLSTVMESRDYHGKLDFRKSFLKNKLSLNGDLSWNRSTSDVNYRKDIDLLEERTAGQGLYLYDTSPDIDEMDELESMIDNDYYTSTGVDIGSTGETYQNIGVDLDSPQYCETIYLYTTPDFDSSLSGSYFSWDVYYSNDGINWIIITNNASFDYNTTEYRFKIDFPSQEARYFKVVNTSHDERSFVGSIYITEIEILGSEERLEGEHDKTTATRWGSNLVINYRPIERLSLNYNFSYEHSKNDSGADYEVRENTEISNGTYLSYIFNKYLSSRAQYWIRLNESNDRKSENDGLSLQFNYTPLDTLSTSLSFNHSEAEEENTRDNQEKEKSESRSNSCLLNMTANLWEGVDVSSNYHITQSENAANTESLGQTINLDLRTKLTKNVTLDSGYSHNWQKNEIIDQADSRTESSSIDITIRYSPSDILYLSADYNYNKNEDANNSSYGFNMSWLPTEKIQLNFNSKYKQNDTDIFSYSLDSSWNISRYIIFKSGLNYSLSNGEKDNENWSFHTRFSARL